MKTKQKVFDQPRPVYSNEVGKQSNEILGNRHISITHDKTRKAKRQIVLPRAFYNKK